MSRLLLFLSLPFALAVPSQRPILETSSEPPQFKPNGESASANANHIFNAIHSSMRQWGSSLQHNGMSFFPAYVPEGTLFYHGTSKAERVTGAQWLAFEIEHAEVFARGRGGGPGGPGGRRPGEGEPGPPGGLPHLEEDDGNGEPRNPGDGSGKGPGRGQPGPGGREPGYLHVYQTNRPMDRYLYVDGMSAGKCSLGTMDTQDFLLLNNFTGGEWQRAEEMCALGKEWNVDGFIRMEAGFEIIHCNFSDGLDFVSHNKRPAQADPESYNDMSQFGYVRAVASRYHGIGGGRVVLDYSSMVSAYFYPLNLTNPSPDLKQTLPRLSSSSPDELARIKSDLKTVIDRPRTDHITNWQEIVDMIVNRYSDYLQYMATRPPIKIFLSEINSLLNIYINYENPSVEDSIKTCTSHYLRSARTSTPQDDLILTALETVTNKICKTLFEVREDLLEKEGALVENDLAGPLQSIHLIRDLNKWLDWTTFKDCGQCSFDQVCYTAIWPFGSAEDHYNPRCKNASEILNGRGSGYWGHGPGGGPGGGRGPPPVL